MDYNREELLTLLLSDSASIVMNWKLVLVLSLNQKLCFSGLVYSISIVYETVLSCSETWREAGLVSENVYQTERLGRLQYQW
jgi:hypothetical protein